MLFAAIIAFSASLAAVDRSSRESPPNFSGYAPDTGDRFAQERAASGQPYDHGDPTPYEQLMLELINRARADPGAEAQRQGIDLNEGIPASQTIEDTPQQPLAFQPHLIEAARAHSRWMLDNDTFSHTGVDGSDPGERMRNAGYQFTGSWTWGENIGWGGSTGEIHFETETIARHDGLFLSPGHRTNILNGNFDEVGAGILDGQFSNSQGSFNAVMATQKFARSNWTPGPLLLGVVFADDDDDAFYDVGEGLADVTIEIESGTWHAVSSASGGYALPYSGDSGELRVTFSGGPLGQPVTRTLTRTGQNLKADLNLAELSGASGTATIVPGSLEVDPSGMRARVTGTAGTAFRLQRSTDLVTWSTVSTHTLGEADLDVTHAPGDPARSFYRVVSGSAE